MCQIKKIFFLIFLINTNITYAQDYFNPLFLGSDIDSIQDLSYLSAGNNLSPGEYFLNLNIGDKFIKSINISFIEDETKKVKPCFTTEVIKAINFNNDTLSKFKTLPDNECIDISKHINNFSYDIDLSKLTLVLSIPQIYLKSIRSTLAYEADWDDGIPVFLMNYNLNGSFSKNKNIDNYSSFFFTLNNRLNLGSWRIKSNLYYNKNKFGSRTYHELKSNNSSISRNINPIKSSLIIGQSVLGSMLFDSVSYTGITLATANEMLPDNERGYSPTIKGIAESRSKITIRQNGNILYQEYINPGPYNIDNLNSVGTSGDYEVELVAADGTVVRYNVPYSSLPNLLRKDSFNYSVSLGKLDTTPAKKNKFSQATLGLGLPLDSTIYTGYQISDDYFSAGLGLGKDMGKLGALSIDAIQAQAKIDEKSYTGGSYRILYAKSFSESGTNIQLTGYRYSTSNYYTFTEASYRNNLKYAPFDYTQRKKNSFQVNLSQNLGDYGQLYLWGNLDSYWNSDYKSKNIQAGWNKTFNNVIVSTSYNKNTHINNTENIFYLSMSIPLSNAIDKNTIYLNNSINYNNSKYNNSTSLYGSALDNNLNYNFYQTVSNDNENKSNLNLRYKANVAEFSTGSSYSSSTKEFDYGVNGSILAHQDGVIFAKEANDTAILVQAIGASGARIDKSGENITIDDSGYALIPYATPYHYNDVGLFPETFGMGYDIDGKVMKVAPTRGAISKVVFDVRKGYNFLVSLDYHGKKIKFGTIVINNDDKMTSIVNDDSTVYLTGVKSHSTYTVKIDKNISCQFTINYHENDRMNNINKINTICK